MQNAFDDPLLIHRFDCRQRPKESAPVYYLGEIPICTAGNLTTILAAPKAGKTAFFGAMMAATLKPDDATCDTFGIRSSNPLGHALIHFDNEQSPSDHWKVLDCAMRRAKLTEQPPWLLSYCLTGFNPVTLQAHIFAQIQRARTAFGGIHSILIDGYADLVLDVNDSKESQLTVTELHKFSIAAFCPIVGILHYNPGSEKGRGHLGSQLERRAETNLALSKDKGSAMTEVWSDKQRNEPIPRGQGPCFAWNKEAGMHMSIESQYELRQKAKRTESILAVKKAFGDLAQMRHNVLAESLSKVIDKSVKTAERKITEMVRDALIRKNSVDCYELAGCNGTPKPSNHPQT